MLPERVVTVVRVLPFEFVVRVILPLEVLVRVEILVLPFLPVRIVVRVAIIVPCQLTGLVWAILRQHAAAAKQPLRSQRRRPL